MVFMINLRIVGHDRGRRTFLLGGCPTRIAGEAERVGTGLTPDRMTYLQEAEGREQKAKGREYRSNEA